MPVSRRLSEVIEECISSFEAQGLAPSSVRSARQTYDHLLAQVGNIQIKYLDTTKVDEFFHSRQSKGEAFTTLNTRRNWIRQLVAHAKLRRYIAHDPVAHVRAFKGLAPKRLLIPQTDFGRLLDSCKDPVERVVVALGLYQFHRAGEIAALKVGDVDLERSLVDKTNFKSRKRDEVPISEELDDELRRWLTHYATVQDGLEPDWFLVPTRTRPMPRQQEDGSWKLVVEGKPYQPKSRHRRPYLIAQAVLERAGYPLRDAYGRSLREGNHTLRRSGARALYDHLLSDRGHDDANRTVQSMLGHSSFTTTEVYLGIDIDRSKRNALIAGRPMFPKSPAANVIPFDSARQGG